MTHRIVRNRRGHLLRGSKKGEEYRVKSKAKQHMMMMTRQADKLAKKRLMGLMNKTKKLCIESKIGNLGGD